MSASTLEQEPATNQQPSVNVALGSYAALAESAWMGSVQATEVLDPLRIAPRFRSIRQVVAPRLPRIRWSKLLTRELTIAEASFVLMASFFSSAALGAIRQVLFNAQYGVGPSANAYYAAFRLPDTLFSLIAGGALSSAMIPVLLNATHEEGDKAGSQLIRLVLTALLAFFALLVLLVELFAPFFVNTILAPGFDPETKRLTILLTRIMLIQPLVLALGSVATAVLNSHNQFILTGLSVISHNVALILGILAAKAVPSVGIYGPTFGVIVGSVLQVIILSPGLAGLGVGGLLAWDPLNQRLREVIRLLIPNGLSVSVNYAGFIADTAFASTAVETASLAALYNGWLLVGLPIALLGQAVGQAAFPRLAMHAEASQWTTLRRTLGFALGIVVVLALAALLALVYLGRLAIQILFERGQFDAVAGDLTYRVLVAYAVALPAYVATEVLTRGLIALRDTQTPLRTNLIQLGGRILLMALLVPRLGVLAVPSALAFTATVETVTLAVILFLKLNRLIRAPAQAAP